MNATPVEASKKGSEIEKAGRSKQRLQSVIAGAGEVANDHALKSTTLRQRKQLPTNSKKATKELRSAANNKRTGRTLRSEKSARKVKPKLDPPISTDHAKPETASPCLSASILQRREIGVCWIMGDPTLMSVSSIQLRSSKNKKSQISPAINLKSGMSVPITPLQCHKRETMPKKSPNPSLVDHSRDTQPCPGLAAPVSSVTQSDECSTPTTPVKAQDFIAGLSYLPCVEYALEPPGSPFRTQASAVTELPMPSPSTSYSISQLTSPDSKSSHRHETATQWASPCSANKTKISDDEKQDEEEQFFRSVLHSPPTSAGYSSGLPLLQRAISLLEEMEVAGDCSSSRCDLLGEEDCGSPNGV